LLERQDQKRLGVRPWKRREQPVVAWSCVQQALAIGRNWRAGAGVGPSITLRIHPRATEEEPSLSNVNC
jgi:hypothetical protein